MDKPEKFHEVLNSFEKIYLTKNEILQEYELVRAAQELNIPIENIKSLFERYRFHRLKSEAPLWKKPFFHTELFFEKINTKLNSMDFFKVLDTIGRLSILVGVTFFIFEMPERAERRQIEAMQTRYQAWQIVISGQGRRTSSGRIDALQVLNEDKVSLTGLDVQNAYLASINLPFADLRGSNLRGANLERANLEGANLAESDLREANLKGVDLKEANLKGTDLQDIASWESALLSNTNFSESIISLKELYKANLIDANFANATFTDPGNLYAKSPSEEDRQRKQVLIEKILSSAYIKQAGLEDKIVQDADFTWQDALVGVNGNYLSLPSTQEQVDTIKQFASRLAIVQKNLNSSLSIQTWYITPIVRERSGFSTRSSHLKGYAVMFTVPGMTNKEVFDKLSWWEGGLCYGDEYIRLDDRPTRIRYRCAE